MLEPVGLVVHVALLAEVGLMAREAHSRVELGLRGMIRTPRIGGQMRRRLDLVAVVAEPQAEVVALEAGVLAHGERGGAVRLKPVR